MQRSVLTAIVVMGCSGLVAEILLLRELLIVFSGNELSIGIILANWLILEAIGWNSVGRRAVQPGDKFTAFTLITVFFSLSLILALFFTRSLKILLGVSIGESIGFLPMLFTSLLYSADLLGGWVGGIIGGVVLLPVLGLNGTCLLVGIFKTVSYAFISKEFAGLYLEVKR